MAEFSGFFDANIVNGEYDRVYLAEHFAKYFSNFIGNGVFGGKSNELIVMQKEQADMSVRVLSGYGYINGYFYENDDELSLSIDVADGILNRIDIVVLRFSKADRTIRLAVKKGAVASVPTAPSINRNGDFYELKLAEIYVGAGTSSITQANIADKRLDSNVCGFVVTTIDHFDTAEFNLQLEAWMNEFKLESVTEVENLMVQLQEVIDAGDLGPIILAIDKLKAQSIESAEYPGCYYRIVDDETEWINPPNEYGVEYRLVERFENKPVYQTTIYVASLPNTSLMNVRLNVYIENLVSVEGFAYDDAASYPFPVYAGGSVSPSAIIQSVGSGLIVNMLSLRTFDDMRSYKAVVTIRYTKT